MQPVLLDAVASQPARQGLLAVGDGQRIRVDRLRLDLAAQRVERDELVRGDRRRPRAGRARTAASSQRRSSASTARVAAAAGLLISCASPAARVPRATSASRCRVTASKLRAVRNRPSMRCAPNGNQALDQSRRAGGGHPQDPAGDRRATRGEVDAVVVPGAEPAGPPAGRVHRAEHRLLAADVAHQVDPARRGAPTRSRPAAPSRNSSSPGVEPHLGAQPRAARAAGRRPARRRGSSGRRSSSVHHIVAR